MPKGHGIIWTGEEKAYLAEITSGRSHLELASMMNARFDRDFDTRLVASAIKRYGLNTGRTGRFTKGNDSWNKGKKFPRGSRPACERMEFKKGHIPHNGRAPVGEKRWRKHDGYWRIKTAQPNKWRMLHVVTWEAAHGKTPGGHVVIFLDGNPLHCELDNLALVSRGALARLNQNGLITTDAELTRSGIAVANVLEAMGKRKEGVAQ